MAESDELAQLKQRVQDAERWRDKIARSEFWNRFDKYWRHEWDEAEVLPVNMIYAFGRSIIPQVYFRNPSVSVTGLRPDDFAKVRVLESLVNHLVRALGIKATIKGLCFDAYGYGTGVCRYTLDRDIAPPSEEDKLSEDWTEPDVDDPSGRIEYRSSRIDNYPGLLQMHPRDVIVPMGTVSADNMPWCCFRDRRSITDIKAEPLYGSGKNDVAPDSIAQNRSRERTQHESDTKVSNDDKFASIYTYHDYKYGKLYSFNLDTDKFLRNTEDELQVDGLPFDALTWNDDRNCFWGIPDAFYVEPMQLLLNDLMTLLRGHARTSIVKWISERNALDKDDIDKLLSKTLRAIVETNGPPSNAIMQVTPTIPAELIKAIEMTWQAARESLGISRVQLGEYEERNRRPAAETYAVREAHQVRMSERQDAVADLLVRIVTKLSQIIFKFWDEQMIVEAIGPGGAPYWVQFTGRELECQCSFNVDPDSQTPMTKQVKQQQALMVGKLLLGVPGADPVELIRYMLREFPDVPIDRILAPLIAQQQGGMGAQGAPMNLGQFGKLFQNGQPSAPLTPQLEKRF